MINKLSSFAGLIFVDGISWGNNLEEAGKYPIRTIHESTNNRVIYTPHCYGPEVYTQQVLQAPDFPNNLGALYMTRFGFLVRKKLPVLIGEWASSNEPDGLEEKWNNYTINWLMKNCLTNNFYWSLDRNASFTPGLFDVDWLTPNARKLEYINRLQPNPTKFEARDGKICITEGAFPEPYCQLPSPELPQDTGSNIAGERSIKSLKYGTYLSVIIRKDGSYGVVMVEHRSVRCEKWFIDEYPDKIDLRPHCSGKIWKYLNVESDGLIDVVDWGQDGQLWAPSRNEDGSFCIRSTHGKYLRAKENGQVVLGDDCDVNARFVIEAFPW
ncbi:hypothetical protein PRIPAC_83651 [Pristionchus pacificus]|uniref:Cellulase domain-containing protein n=1 Tax=Pristionchus pacificus TaxID=54126 RepID=A0A454XML6_PRIPA|nr:hypothetical protein PRIPAC_83651 [Pristionchus pacificus]|eukprot:PDM69147.1 hypothetical protein PRIPAC_47449 [Pristionchus pacificus]